MAGVHYGLYRFKEGSENVAFRFDGQRITGAERLTPSFGTDPAAHERFLADLDLKAVPYWDEARAPGFQEEWLDWYQENLTNFVCLREDEG